ncbi:MAG: hypothetical protein WA584_23370 [Pyrinomonadaceae bacterium]
MNYAALTNYLALRLPEFVEDAIGAEIIIEREIHFPGATLTLFEFAPSGEIELLSLGPEEVWTVRRSQKDENGNESNDWEIEISAAASGMTAAIANKAVLAACGDFRFKVDTPESPVGNKGFWKLRGELD